VQLTKRDVEYKFNFLCFVGFRGEVKMDSRHVEIIFEPLTKKDMEKLM
jgi:hypothetical protein